MNSNTDSPSSDTDSKVPKEDNIILSSHIATNSEVFPKVLQLHVENGAKIADVTYGKGVFWNNISCDKYELYCTDINPDRSPSMAGTTSLQPVHRHRYSASQTTFA